MDHERCSIRSPGEMWIMRGAAEDDKERDGS